ncbi:lipoprotein insertase outer membrane protein LolB [Nitrosomonas marina]|uniref:Outer-membrane lipoprotein LolB n=1 Tax=Nitrosomonas marina TaxID=917 RepID=A0A1H8IAI3_9PROT|nr:lipoprotein insertase outer membrane protein LolB [Nitrosomonas marina]SEN65165.1 outer membrane lipoprotein LolB [Nitrosomonas marina]
MVRYFFFGTPGQYSGNGRWWALFICLPLLAGCAGLTIQTDQVARTEVFEPATDRVTAMADGFELLGRVAVRNEQQRFSGNVHWQHTSVEDTLMLLSPLGQAVAEIVRKRSGVTLTTSKQETFYADNVEDLTAELLGWRLPLNGLRYWVQGVHSPLSRATVDFDSEDRIIAIRQDGWEIIYRQYYQHDDESFNRQMVRPRIVELHIEGLMIRLVVDNWTEI